VDALARLAGRRQEPSKAVLRRQEWLGDQWARAPSSAREARKDNVALRKRTRTSFH
jgi:hypothetical protein